MIHFKKNLTVSKPAFAKTLHEMYLNYHLKEFLGLDPLICVREQKSILAQEIVGLIAATLAYGRVERIIAVVNQIVASLNKDVVSAVTQGTYKEHLKQCKGIYHRFNDEVDIALLLSTISVHIKKYGSLGEYFKKCMHSTDGSMAATMDAFSSGFKKNAQMLYGDSKKSFNYLFPSPFSKSACKRLNMYFRWMIRSDDGIDLGLWDGVKTDMLIAPMDAHICEQAKRLGLLDTKNATWANACVLTAAYAQCDPIDPVKYDFSLCRYGMISLRKGIHGNT